MIKNIVCFRSLNTITSIQQAALRLLLLLLLPVAFVANAGADSHYYAKVTAKANPTGGGKVYVNTSDLKGSQNYAQQDENNKEKDFYLWATTSYGYKFSKWDNLHQGDKDDNQTATGGSCRFSDNNQATKRTGANVKAKTTNSDGTYYYYYVTANFTRRAIEAAGSTVTSLTTPQTWRSHGTPAQVLFEDKYVLTHSDILISYTPEEKLPGLITEDNPADKWVKGETDDDSDGAAKTNGKMTVSLTYDFSNPTALKHDLNATMTVQELCKTDGGNPTFTQTSDPVAIGLDLTPVFKTDKTTHTFPATEVNTTATTTINLKDYGDLPIDNEKCQWDLALTGANSSYFSASRSGSTVTITYKPTSDGSHSATLAISATWTDAAGTKLKHTADAIALSGSATLPSFTLGSQLSFETVSNIGTDTRQLTLQDVQYINSATIAITGTDADYFSASDYNTTGKSFDITFTAPTNASGRYQTGTYTATATVTGTATANSAVRTITLTAEVTASPLADFTVPTAITFNGGQDVADGETADEVITLTNMQNVVGTPSISIAGTDASMFAVQGTYNSEDNTFTVRFTAGGTKGGKLTANATITAENYDGVKVVKTVTLNAFMEEVVNADARVTKADGTLIKEGTWAECLTSANANAGSTLTVLRDIVLDLPNVQKKQQDFTNDVTLDLNGKTLSTTTLNATYYALIRVNKAGKTLTITDSRSGGKIVASGARDNRLDAVEVTAGNLVLEKGYLEIKNTNTSTATADRLYSCVVYVGTKSQFTMNGGELYAERGARDAYGVYGAVDATYKAQVTINGGTITAKANTYAYGLRGYCDFFVNGGAIHAETLTGGYAYGIQLRASANATATSGYYGTLEMTAGTVESVSKTTYAYGVFADRHRVGTGTNVSVDGTHSNQETGQITITGGKITATCPNNTNAWGVTVYGSFSSKHNKHIKTIIKNATIEATATTTAYGVYACAEINGTVGACHQPDVEITSSKIKATTTTGGTAYGIYGTSTSATIFKYNQANYYGEYACAAKITLNDCDVTSDTKTTGSYAIITSTRARTTYDPLSPNTTTRYLGGNAEAYPELIINEGRYSAYAHNTTGDVNVRAISFGGNTTINGGTFHAEADGGRYTRGIYGVAGKLKITNATVEAINNGVYSTSSNTATTYGIFLDCGIATPTGFSYRAEGEINNCKITATTVKGNEVYGVYLNCSSRHFNQTYLRKDSLDNKWAHNDAGTGTYDLYKQIYPTNDVSIAGKCEINGGEITAQAQTLQNAYGIYVGGSTYSQFGKTTASGELTVRSTSIKATTGTVNAYGIRGAGPTVVENCNITTESGTNTSCGIYQQDKKIIVTGTTITSTAKGATAYGLYANAANNTNTSATNSTINGVATTIIPAYNYYQASYGELELGEGNVVTAETKGGNTAYAVYLHAAKSNWTTGAAAGAYAVAAKATVNGGKYTAKASGTTAYALGVAGQQVQGSAVAQPELTVNGGKFKGYATGGTSADLNANGQMGSCVLNGGYYTYNTNLDKYIAAGKTRTDVPTGTPEYTEGYRYQISSGMTGNDVFSVYTQATTPVLQKTFKSFTEALSYVSSTSTALTIVLNEDYVVEAGEYVLPSNATLLVPYIATQKKAVGTSLERKNGTAARQQFRKMTFDSGANLTCKGKIEVGAIQISTGSAGTGMVYTTYGRIDMLEGSHIDLENGSALYAWGYITGKGELNAKNGSKVYEMFVFGDWSGGAQAYALYYDKKAFIVTHYFYQNIEAPIYYRPGALAYGYSTVYASSSIEKVNDIQMIGLTGSNALFAMNKANASADTWVKKVYHPETDRMEYVMNSGASLNSLVIKVSGQTFDPSNFILPICSNMTITLNEGDCDVKQNFYFMPGSELIINKEATLVIPSGKSLYFYDADDYLNGTDPNYSGKTSYSKLYRIGYSPSWTTNPRNISTNIDAELFVHGKIELNGNLYTTTGGANIHSTNEDAGKITFYAKGTTSSATIYQRTAGEGSGWNGKAYYEGHTCTSAKLKNGSEYAGTSDEFSPTAGTAAGDTWVYSNNKWVNMKEEGCFNTETSGTKHYYIHAGDIVEVEYPAQSDHAYKSVSTPTRYFINAADCMWWEVEPQTIGGVQYYVANQEKYDNYGTCFTYDATNDYWIPKTVTVTWKNYDGTTLATYDDVPLNTSPKYNSANPTRTSDDTYQYAWTGWNLGSTTGKFFGKYETLDIVTGDVEYYAHMDSEKFKYTITFRNDDNSLLEARLWEVGETPKLIDITEPTKQPTVEKIYSFKGWDKTIEPVSKAKGAVTYIAQYDALDRPYPITFLDYDAKTVLEEKQVEYNSSDYTYTGAVNGVPYRESTAAFSYDFKGWKGKDGTEYVFNAANKTYSPALPAVNGAASYTAVYTTATRRYKVTFDAQGGTVSMPVVEVEYDKALSSKLTALPTATREGYTFNGWFTEATGGIKIALSQRIKADITYYAQWDVSKYTIKFVDGNGTTLSNPASADNKWNYGTTPNYTGATPTKAEDADYTYEFSGTWSDGTNEYTTDNLPTVQGDKTYTAQFNAIPKDFGEYMDIVDWNGSTAVLNMNGYTSATALANWTIEATGKTYTKANRNADRTMNIDLSSLSLNANDEVTIIAKGKEGVVESQRKYRVPYIYNGNATLSGTQSNSIIVVRSGQLKVSANTTVAAIYVAPSAELIINSGVTLTVTDKLVLRTSAWESAILTNNGTLTIEDGGQLYYSRQASSNKESYQFGLPFDVNIADIKLSNGKNAKLKSNFILQYYDAQSRAENGINGNWKEVTDTKLNATQGYQLFSNSAYYQEFLFPVTYSENTQVAVQAYSGDSEASNQGWNYIVSPQTKRLTYTIEGEPDEALKIAKLDNNNKTFSQLVPTTIEPAMPFYYQAESNGYLDFSGSEVTKHSIQRNSNGIQTQWLQIELTQEEGSGDITNIYLHPDKFNYKYEQGYDVSKLSLTGNKPIVYSSLQYGDLAFAALPDDIAQAGIPLTIFSDKTQKLSFNAIDNKYLKRINHIWLNDTYEQIVIDLLDNQYDFEAIEGTTQGRFYLQAEFNEEQAEIVTNSQDYHTDNLRISFEENKIHIDGIKTDSDIRLFDAVGKLVYYTKTTNESATIVLPTQGVYLLKINDKVEKVLAY